MPYSLKGRNVLITGGSRGLGAMVAEKFAAEGSNVAINYCTSEERAKELATKIEAEHKVKAVVLQGDVALRADCENLVKKTIELLGGIDVIISNAGWTKISRFGDLNALTDDEWDQCWSTNVKANLHLFREAEPTFTANPDGGAFIITSSVAGATPGGSSMAYSVSKAAGLHMMKGLASSQSPKIRTNAVLPGLLLTEWGQRFTTEVKEGYREKTALKSVPDVEDCADVFITIAKNTSMTGQEIQVVSQNWFPTGMTDGMGGDSNIMKVRNDGGLCKFKTGVAIIEEDRGMDCILSFLQPSSQPV
ncbi:Short chain dehydrogenase/reductase family protein [Arthroderma uncinatum]|uniref:Short chain dehydrogenase/reductase family protein n=1 Tax=Arthroderma uncinatum TaxID=74035 RepID=UPI00144AD75E|nr:Short chain dehydrogenase/reductase family protein [Arthroderma uncinatum]KAF3491867.1 Short chain dehydrogenase/reductase family protein [Arthroderma uncinatum]